MMSNQKKSWIVLAIVVGLALTSQAWAQKPTPEQIAKRCVTKVNEVAAHCAEKNQQTAQKTTEIVEQLLAAGQFEEARDAAHQGIEKIKDRTRNCVAKIHKTCKDCIEVLRGLERPDLVRRVQEACENTVGRARASAERAVTAIREALPVEA